MKYLIFDFDGVLADTLAVNLQARINIGYVRTMEESIAKMHGYFDNRPNHTRDHTLSETELRQVGERITQMGEEIHKLGFNLFDGFFDEIKLITDKKVALVSTGTVYVKAKPLPEGFNPTHVLGYEDHHSKEEKIEHICKDWGVSVKEIYYFTDSKADVYELENFLDREKIIGVAWGYCGYDKLSQLLPENQILKKFADIRRIFK
ncbi:MAG: hypothetical protein Q7S86_00135 [bacterium]|nr:hypothetical protein [bacterium]